MGKILTNIKDFFIHPAVQLALVLGACIIGMSLVSKYLLDTPISDSMKSIPGLVALVAGYLGYNRKLDDKWKRPWVANTATFLATVIIIAVHL